MILGEDLQWGKVCNVFFSTIADLPGERLQWGEGLQYNTGKVVEEFIATCRNLQLPVAHVSD